MDVELEPEQPPEVAAAIAQLAMPAPAMADSWWRAGVDESLET